MPSHPFHTHGASGSDEGADASWSEEPGAVDYLLAADESLVELRCSVVVSRRNEVLLLRRRRGDAEEWVLPGGRPRPGEGMLACARREVAEETGVAVTPGRCAFVADVVAPRGGRRRVELVFTAQVAPNHPDELIGEDGALPLWVGVDDVRHLDLRPPVAGFLSDVVRGRAQTAPYLGNLWRPETDPTVGRPGRRRGDRR